MLYLLGIIASIITILTFILYLYDKMTRVRYKGELRTYYGNTSIIFGTNTFSGTPKILVVDDKPIFTATVKKGKLFISIIIFDRNGNIVAQIEKNKWVINKNNFFKMDTSKSEVKVINQQGEMALHCIALSNGSVKVNGTFYIGRSIILATDEGLQINVLGNSVGLGGS